MKPFVSAREIAFDRSFEGFLVTSYNLHRVDGDPRRVRVSGTGQYEGSEDAIAACYLSYGMGGGLIRSGDGATVEARPGSGFPILGTATFDRPVPRIEAEGIYCRAVGPS